MIKSSVLFVGTTDYAPNLLARVLSMRRSHHNFLDIGQITKKTFFGKNLFVFSWEITI